MIGALYECSKMLTVGLLCTILVLVADLALQVGGEEVGPLGDPGDDGLLGGARIQPQIPYHIACRQTLHATLVFSAAAFISASAEMGTAQSNP